MLFSITEGRRRRYTLRSSLPLSFKKAVYSEYISAMSLSLSDSMPAAGAAKISSGEMPEEYNSAIVS